MAELALDALESKGLIRLATVEPELEYLFRHALVQDAAYGSLLKQERRQLHGVVGDALEQLYPDRRGELAAILARHFEQAGETDRAIEYLVEAARYAYDRYALTESYDLYGRALALLPESGTEVDRRRLEISLGRVKAGFSFISADEQIDQLEPLVDQARQLGDARLEADVLLHLALTRQYRGERPGGSGELQRTLERVSEIARELNDPLIDALPKSLVGLFQVFSGDIQEGVATLRQVAPVLEQKRDFVGSSFALVALAIGLARLGEFDAATDAARRASDVADKGDIIAKLDSMIGESVVRSLRGELDEAEALGRQCTQLAMDVGSTACLVSSSFFLGDTYMREGRFGDARIVFEQTSQIADITNEHMFRPSIAAYLRSTAASLGEFAPMARSWGEAIAEARLIGDSWAEANIIWKRAETEAKKEGADVDQIWADFADAAGRFETMGARPYLARVLRGWGEALLARELHEAGLDKLRRSAALFEEMGIVRERDEVRTALGDAA
jgi:tetratricopeptide (TPR) repeat protein